MTANREKTGETGADEIRKKLARNVRAAIFDGDGVIFTSRVFLGNGGEALKERSFRDGQGISLLRAAGIQVALITAEKSTFAREFLEKMNSLPSVKEGTWPPMEMVAGVVGEGKVRAAEAWIAKHRLSWDECAYMGDDVGDYAVMERVGFRAAPSDAEASIRNFAHFVAGHPGGQGAVRDFCNFLLEAKGIDPTKLALQ